MPSLDWIVILLSVFSKVMLQLRANRRFCDKYDLKIERNEGLIKVACQV